MQVRITNVTDGPGKKPVEARIYKKRLRPGAWMDVPVQFVDEKVRKLELAGVIIIGKLPPWYSDYEARRKVRNLTAEEVTANVELKTNHQKMIAARKAAVLQTKAAEIKVETKSETKAIPVPPKKMPDPMPDVPEEEPSRRNRPPRG